MNALTPQQAVSLLADQLQSNQIDWNLLGSILESNPRAFLPRRFFLLGCSILYFACKSEAPLSVVELIVLLHPETIKEKNIDGDLPLHVACRNKQKLKVIQFLVQQHPNALLEKDIDGCLPLHLACETKQSLKVTQLLVQQHLTRSWKRTSMAGSLCTQHVEMNSRSK